MDVTWTPRLAGPEAAVYDAFVLASPAGHNCQSRPWAELARVGGHVGVRFAIVRDGSRVAGTAMLQRPSAGGLPLPWAWIERGPVVARVEDVGPVVRAIARAARRRGIAHLRVMPYWADADALRVEHELRAASFHDVQRPGGSHALTLRMDIGSKSAVELFAGKAREQVRWRARQAEKAGARARRGEAQDWPRLRAMHASMMRAQHKRERPGAWWLAVQHVVAGEGSGELFVCEHGARVVAACVVLRHGTRATYAWGASILERLPFSKAIPPLLAGVHWARDAGCTVFDLGGIPLEGDPDPKRNAIATFKLDFDKKRVRLVREHARWW